MTDKDVKDREIKAEIKRISEECLVAAERHFASEAPWISLNYVLGVPSALLAIVAGTTAFADPNETMKFLLGNGTNLTAVISFTVAILTGISTYLDPIKKSSAHTAAAKSYQVLYNEIRLFLIDPTERSQKEMMLQLKVLIDKLNQLNQSSPSLSKNSYKTAIERLKNNEGKVYQLDGMAEILG